MCPRERFSLYNSLCRLVLCYKKDWATLLHFIYFCYLLLVTNYLAIKQLATNNSVLAEITFLETACHFLLLLVGFDTLTYRRDYDRSPILVGHQGLNCVRPSPPVFEGIDSPWCPVTGSVRLVLVLTSMGYCGQDYNNITNHLNTMRRGNYMGG